MVQIAKQNTFRKAKMDELDADLTLVCLCILATGPDGGLEQRRRSAM